MYWHRVNAVSDHRSFRIEIGLLTNLLKKIFFLRPSMGVLQTDEIKHLASAFSFGRVAGTCGVIRGF